MYRYQITGQDENGDDVYEWVAIPDAAIAQAIQDAADAQETADGKITSYYQDDAPTNANGELSEGDLWTDTDDDDATYRWDDDGGQDNNGEWVRIGLASFTDVNTAITDQVGYCELTIGSGSNAVKSVSTANTTQTLCQAAQADSNKPSNYTYAWKSDGAIASELKTVTSSVDGNTATIQENISSIDGLEAQYTVKIDNNGHVSGFGLASQVAGDSAVSEFMVAADRFSVVNPSSSMEQISNIYSGGGSNRYLRVLGLSNLANTNNTLTVTGLGDGYDGTYSIVGAGNSILSGISVGYCVQITGVPSGFPSNAASSSPADFIAAYPVAKAGLDVDTEVPFVVATGSTQINGVTVPAGTYINSAMIADATIKNAQINDLTADKITASLLNTVDFYGNTIAGSTIYLGGTITYTTDSDGNNIGIQSVADPKVSMTSTGAVFAVDAFTIDNPGGNDATPFSVTNNVVSIDTALIADGTITNAQIGNQIASTAYLADNNTGWAISKDGDAILNDATFRGTLDVGGSSGSRLTISSTKIEVYDGTTLRVKIGDLS
jgi:hypothetical protein